MEVLEITSGKRYHESKRIGHLMMDYARQIKQPHIRNEVRRAGDALTYCGSRIRVYKKEFKKNGKIVPVLVRYTCKSRACPPCNQIRNRSHRKRVDTLVSERGEKNFIFLTVTSRGKFSVEGVRAQFDFLSKTLGNFFRTPLMKSHIAGGFRSIEGNSDSEGMINPHAHILLETNGQDLSENKKVLKFLQSDSYQDSLKVYLKNNPTKTIDQVAKTTFRLLKRGRLPQLVWSALLYSRGLGAICDVQEVSKFKNPGKNVGEELCKYMTKTMKLDGTQLPQFILAMKGKRAFSSWGSLKMNKKELDRIEVEGDESDGEDEDGEYTLTFVGNIQTVANKALYENDSFCQRALGLALKENIITLDFDDH